MLRMLHFYLLRNDYLYLSINLWRYLYFYLSINCDYFDHLWIWVLGYKSSVYCNHSCRVERSNFFKHWNYMSLTSVRSQKRYIFKLSTSSILFCRFNEKYSNSRFCAALVSIIEVHKICRFHSAILCCSGRVAVRILAGRDEDGPASESNV